MLDARITLEFGNVGVHGSNVLLKKPFFDDRYVLSCDPYRGVVS